MAVGLAGEGIAGKMRLEDGGAGHQYHLRAASRPLVSSALESMQKQKWRVF
jgi:hypothetical protein